MGLCGSSFLKYNKNNSIINEDSTTILNESQNSNREKRQILDFKAMIGEKELSIFVLKNTKIEIEFINNNKPSWSFLQNDKLKDYMGNEDYKYNNYNVGCFLARISTSKKYNIPINNRIKFKADETGSLLISSNLDPNDYSYYEPHGSILINIIGGNFVAKRNIDEFTGYKYLLYGNKNEKCFSLNLKEISRYINKARSNIKKYINDFMLNFKDKNFNINPDIDIPLCEIDNKLFEIAEEHCKDLCINGTFGHIGTDGCAFKKRLEKYNIVNKKCEECIIYGFNNPILIVNYLIEDKYSKNKKNRKILLNKNFTKVGISLNKHISLGYCCVIIFQE